ncbi:MAG TPA: hypothetical protein K8U94_09985, partial [Acinetobacter johnsonii]|nr:hypothetical protein [Acinetobacter johnsonii]
VDNFLCEFTAERICVSVRFTIIFGIFTVSLCNNFEITAKITAKNLNNLKHARTVSDNRNT